MRALNRWLLNTANESALYLLKIFVMTPQSLFNPYSCGFLLFGAITGLLVSEDMKLRKWFPTLYKQNKIYAAVLMVNLLFSAIVFIFSEGGIAENRGEKVSYSKVYIIDCLNSLLFGSDFKSSFFLIIKRQMQKISRKVWRGFHISKAFSFLKNRC